MHLPNTMMNINQRKTVSKLLLLCVLSLLSTKSFAQSKYKDTVVNTGLVPTSRIGIGWAGRSFNLEAGLALRKIIFAQFHSEALVYYSTVGYSSTFKKAEDNIWSVKAGAEFNGLPMLIGLETKYQTNFRTNDIVVSPKAGIGVLGMVAFIYAYNISVNKRPFANYGRHEFMVIVNVSPSEL